MYSSYGELCTEVYNFTKPVGHSFGREIEYYKERLIGCEGLILEAGVGSGRVLIPLMEAGLQMEGLDSSPTMLESCKSRCDERGLKVNLHEGELQKFKLPNRYDAIIIPAGSFLLLEKREESLAALERFHHHLKPGGRLIIDLFLQDEFESKAPRLSTYELPTGDIITMENRIVEVSHLHQYVIRHLKYEKWRSGQLIQSELQRFPLRWYGLEEFKLVLERFGFRDIVVSADYEYGKAPSNDRQTYTFEAIRA
ncbi:class I SAM-dependent methyltransferase [Paenibacillus marinisediminis]